MIENTLQELTEAVRQLTAALNNRGEGASLAAPKTMKAKTEPRPEVAKAEPVEAVAAPAPAPVLPPAGDAAEPVAVGPVTQADLRDVASRLLAAKRLPDILRINKEHDIRRITECPPEKYEAVYASLNAALADATKP